MNTDSFTTQPFIFYIYKIVIFWRLKHSFFQKIEQISGNGAIHECYFSLLLSASFNVRPPLPRLIFIVTMTPFPISGNVTHIVSGMSIQVTTTKLETLIECTYGESEEVRL